MKTLYAVFKPVLGYEEQQEVYFTCSTREVALACADRMNRFLTRLNARLPKLPDYTPDIELPDEHPDWVAYNKVADQFEDVRNRARWPYGIDLFYWRDETDPIKVIPMPLRDKL